MRAVLLLLPSIVLAQQPASIAPTGADGKPLNLGFESGSLEGWTAEGDAFVGQPIEGDVVAKRRNDMRSQHAGKFWIGGYDGGKKDDGIGTLISAPFKVTHPWASFLVGAGDWPETRVEIVAKASGNVIHVARGAQTEDMARSVVDLSKLQGQEIVIRLVDQRKGHWGHVNFDDFVFHVEKPNFPAPKRAVAAAPAGPVDLVQHAGLPADKAAQAATVPAGYELKVFAAEPDVINPESFCIDDRARLWVVEGMTYPKRIQEAAGTPAGLGGKDRILVFEDTDGDGKADKRTVFMEGLNLVSGIEVGHGGVFIGAAPYLLFVPVENWDEPKPSAKPEVLLDGWGYQDTHETLNTFHWGPDGWLYGCHGVFTHSEVGSPGTPKDKRTRINAGIWRYQPVSRKFEVFAHGTSNPWGIDWNADGDLFSEACVIPHLFHILDGGRYHRQAGSHFNQYTYNDIKTIADHRHYVGGTPHGGNNRSDAAGGGHAHAGLCIPKHPSWPDGVRGGVLMGNIHGARINMDVLERKGSGFVAHHGADFINFHDKASQIVDIREGPDGTLFMIDWYDLNQCHNTNPEKHDYTTGRIYRLAKKGAKLAPVAIGKLKNEELVKLIHSEDPWKWEAAVGELAARKITGDEVQRLFEATADGKSEPKNWSRVVSLGTVLNREVTTAHATKMVETWEDTMGAIQYARMICAVVQATQPNDALVAALADQASSNKSPVVRLALASICQRLTVAQRLPIVKALLAHEEDKDDHNLPLMYWYAAEPIIGADPAAAGDLLGVCKIPVIQEYIARRLAGS